MPSLTIENYVKAIYQICVEQQEQPAATGQIATALAVSPGTVTSMMKTLSESELATYTPYEGVLLTEAGRALALRILRRHRLIELFLVKTLNLTWDEVHEEAEHMEHAVSDFLVDRIDKCLGFLEFDPHGDPIPSRDGKVASFEGMSLNQCSAGRPFRMVRVLDQSPDFLRYLSEAGLPLGTVGEVVDIAAEAGTVTVDIDGTQTTLGQSAAEKILVATPDAPHA